MRAPTERNCEPAAGRISEFLRTPFERGKSGRQDTQTALEILSFMLDVITVKVLRLERSFRNQRARLRRETRETAIISASLMLAMILGFAVAWRLM
jgi:hypothetical protein